MGKSDPIAEFEYSTTQLQEKVAELNEQSRSPVYLVHFTQNAYADTARDLLSTNFCTKEGKHSIARALDDADFRSPYGRELSKIIRHAVGIHHAGLLPKYRLLVEKLTACGLLKVICSTDTLEGSIRAVTSATNHKSSEILSNDRVHGQATQSLGIPQNFFQSGSRRCSLSFSDS